MDAPEASRTAIGKFCESVCGFVRFSPDHAAITAELTAHMEDRRDALLERNSALSPEEAEARAVAAMGDPEAVGRALNESHSPLLGWFQIWFRRAVWVLAAMVLLVNLPQTAQTLTGLAAPPVYYDTVGLGHLLAHYDEYDVTADLAPDAVWQYEGYTFSIPRAVVTRSSDGATQELYYLMKVTHANPWHRGPEISRWLWAEDDVGNIYPSQHEDMSLNAVDFTAAYPFVSYYDLQLTGIDPEATSVTLRFDRYGENAIYLTLPLKGGT